MRASAQKAGEKAAIDLHRAAGDERGCIRQKKPDRCRNLARVGDARDPVMVEGQPQRLGPAGQQPFAQAALWQPRRAAERNEFAIARIALRALSVAILRNHY